MRKIWIVSFITFLSFSFLSLVIFVILFFFFISLSSLIDSLPNPNQFFGSLVLLVIKRPVDIITHYYYYTVINIGFAVTKRTCEPGNLRYC